MVGSISWTLESSGMFFSVYHLQKTDEISSMLWTEGGKFKTAFPFNVICTTREQATALNTITVRQAFDELERVPTAKEQIEFVKQSPVLSDLLSNEGEVYAVVYGHRKGIYFDW